MKEKDINEFEIPNGLEEEMSDFIDSMDAAENVMAEERRRKGAVRWSYVAGAAATVALLVTFLFRQPAMPEDTFTDPHEAYACVEQTLAAISEKMGNGVQQARRAGDKIDAGTAKIRELYDNKNND